MRLQKLIKSVELEISIVIPVFNEEEHISMPSSAILHRAMSDIGYSYEYILVDDGSTDESYKGMKKVYKRNKISASWVFY